MSVFLVRHADAKSRASWDGADGLRPLTKKGERQAAALVGAIGTGRIRRILSSPAVRCVDTVTPLSTKLAVPVIETKELAEGGDAAKAYKLLVDVAASKGDAVLCAHGDLIPELLRLASRDGLRLRSPARWSKGSTWTLVWDHGKFTEGRYSPPSE